jgi:hypothetical protein
MEDIDSTRFKAHRANLDRYSRLLTTQLTDIERNYVHQRIAEEHRAIEALVASQVEKCRLMERVTATTRTPISQAYISRSAGLMTLADGEEIVERRHLVFCEGRNHNRSVDSGRTDSCLT